MTIREIKEQDNTIIATIIRTAMKEFNADPKTTILGDPTLDTMYQNYRSPNSVYYILEENNTVQGGCGIRHLDNSSENICELQRMFLLKTSRGKGYGKILIDLCIKKAREFGYEKIYLETLSEMNRAISVYETAGFRKIEFPLGNTGHGGCNVYMIFELKNK
jgi:putative acetyltransferase